MVLYGIMVLAFTSLLKAENEKSAEVPLAGNEERGLPFVSVIVPVCNEAENLGRLINSLSGQNYNGGFEVILADDHSTDGSAKIISSYSFKWLRYLPPNSDAVGKKRNLDRAVVAANGELILTTDADCIHSPEWIRSMTEFFFDSSVQLVTGPVNIIKKDFFTGLQSVEFLSLMAATRIAVEFKNPVMANGANLAYRKTAYQLAMGYEDNFKISSGDDQFLLSKVKKIFPDSIRFSKNPGAVVQTNAASTMIDFFNQRLRWAGKWKHSSDNLTNLTAVLVLFIQICAIALLLSPFFSQYLWFLFLVFKVIPDYLLLSRTARLQNLSWRNFEFMVVSVFYPFYVLITGILSFFITPDWKSRPVKA